MCQINDYLKSDKEKKYCQTRKRVVLGQYQRTLTFNVCNRLRWLTNAHENVNWKCYCSVFC